MRTPWAALVLLAAGALHTLAYSQTQSWPLLMLAMALLLALLRGRTPAQAALLGGTFGLGWLAAGVWWLFISMHRYGALPAPLAAVAVWALAAALSLYLAVAAALMVWLWRRLDGLPLAAGVLPDSTPALGPALGQVLVLALAWAGLWLLAELARAQWLTGFPWVASGYALVDSPWAAWAPWVGVYGMGALAAWLTALWVFLPWRAAPARPSALGWAWVLRLAATALVLGLPWALPSGFSVSSGVLTVSLLQTHVAQDEKFASERLPQHLESLAGSLRAARGQLVLAPETAVPLLPYQLDAVSEGYWQILQMHFANQNRTALIGVPLGDANTYTNSAVSMGLGDVYRYDKHHLVPFGEFIPSGFRWFTEAMNIPLGDFARGPVNAASLVTHGQRIGPNICYEDLFGEELAVRLLRPGDAPTVLANLSNIGWFGDTVALPQHLNISRMRTLELERPMLRATNTGVTAIIDHRGQVVAQLPPFVLATLEGQVEGRQGLTPYAAWVGRFGLLPLWLVGLALVLLGAWCRFSPQAGPSAPNAPGAAG